MKEVKMIKECGSWSDYVNFVEEEIAKLADINKINGEIDLEAKKKAIKLIRDILYIVNN